MSLEKKFLLQNANLTGLTKFLNENFKKKNLQPFSCRDVLGYIDRKQLPSYLGNYKINEIEQVNCSVKLYNLEIISETKEI